MCRFIAYLGQDILLDDVLVKPSDSLIKQSLSAKESKVFTNGDGFGIGWYTPQISSEPGTFHSVFPAWNDRNLLHLTSKLMSPCFFGHVRAASTGAVDNYNCHPFIHNNWMLMHNGEISHFLDIKRHLCDLLDDDLYQWIKGSTDSEHLFALFLQLAKGRKCNSLVEVAALLSLTFKTIDSLLEKYARKNACYYNICLTDGKRIVASRYCTNKNIQPESLHYLKGDYFWSKKDFLKTKDTTNKPCVIVSSEKLTDFTKAWQTVPANHFLLVEEDYQIQIEPIYP